MIFNYAIKCNSQDNKHNNVYEQKNIVIIKCNSQHNEHNNVYKQNYIVIIKFNFLDNKHNNVYEQKYKVIVRRKYDINYNHVLLNLQFRQKLVNHPINKSGRVALSSYRAKPVVCQLPH